MLKSQLSLWADSFPSFFAASVLLHVYQVLQVSKYRKASKVAYPQCKLDLSIDPLSPLKKRKLTGLPSPLPPPPFPVVSVYAEKSEMEASVDAKLLNCAQR